MTVIEQAFLEEGKYLCGHKDVTIADVLLFFALNPHHEQIKEGKLRSWYELMCKNDSLMHYKGKLAGKLFHKL